MKLTDKQIEVMKSVRGGADILDYQAARECRKLAKLGLVHVCEPMGDYAVEEKRPYLGAILTGKGKEQLATRGTNEPT